MMQVAAQFAIFPRINAVLNGTSAVLLVIGRGFIKRGRMAAHRAVMITALVSSTLFLSSYLYYHAHVGSVHFQGQGWSRPLYFSILISHTLLAITIVPMVIITLNRGSTGAIRPAPGNCSLDLSVVAVCVGDRSSDLFHAVQAVCVKPFYHRGTETQRNQEVAFLCDSVSLW